MRVTNVEFSKYEKGKMLAWAHIEFDGVMQVKNWKIFQGDQGNKYRLGFPSEMDKKGKKKEDGSPQFWNTVWIDFKTEDGKLFMNELEKSVFERFDQGASGRAPAPQQSQEQGPSIDGEIIPF